MENRMTQFLDQCIQYFEDRMDVDDDTPNEEAHLYTRAIELRSSKHEFMRQVRVLEKVWNPKRQVIEKHTTNTWGYFHGWVINSAEALIEIPDGKIISISSDCVQFIIEEKVPYRGLMGY